MCSMCEAHDLEADNKESRQQWPRSDTCLENTWASRSGPSHSAKINLRNVSSFTSSSGRERSSNVSISNGNSSPSFVNNVINDVTNAIALQPASDRRAGLLLDLRTRNRQLEIYLSLVHS